ncbi:MAG: DUF2207 domain-containing protein [Clostridia bacterium]|nr:DUF2207 domain-containing protein [Clostridia bacterium]
MGRDLMKKRVLTTFIVAFFISVSMSINANAYSPEIRDIDTTVRLDNDGTAYITQVWDVTVADGTEWYLVQGNLGDIAISDFSVKDENGTQYVNEGSWDTERSINEKAGKCGIVDKGDGDYELCWGVGSYGEHTYTASYKMTNVVKKYSDADGFIQRFVNDELSSTPQHIKVTIYSDDVQFSDENSDIWSFGFEGSINFTDDGKIVAESSSSNISYVNVMVGFTSGIFNPTSNNTDTTFEEIKEIAFEDSDYDYDSSYDEDSYYEDSHSNFIGVASSFYPIIILMLIFVLPKVLGKGKTSSNRTGGGYGLDRKSIKDVEYCRNIPFSGSLLAPYNVLNNLNMLPSQGAIISAYILRWLQQGKITIKETPKKSFLGIGADKMQPSIIFVAEADDFSEPEKSLYKMLVRAAGGDKILQEKEFYKWAKEHYKTVEDWLDTVDAMGAQELETMGATESVQKSTFFNLIKYKRIEFSERGKKQALDMFGFKKYLEDFTIINERRATEVQLWDDYLVFASLFGIADKVSEEFKKLYPDYFFKTQDGADINALDFYVMMHMINTISYAGASGASAGHSAAQAAQASAGGGGFSSFGGGGGFSGGGSGGGSR